jgi:hypothetical protein
MSSQSVTDAVKSYPVRVRLLLEDSSMLVEARLLRYWKVFAHYESLSGACVEEFVMPAEVDTLDKLAQLVEFTIKHDEIKITHIKSALHVCVNLLNEPYNVPEWAFLFMMNLELEQVFEMARLAEAVQFAALSELCAAFLANIFVSFTFKERMVLCGKSGDIAKEERDEQL